MKCMAALTILSLSVLINAPASGQAKADIVDTAVQAGSFKTLVAALKAADLVDTLRGKGPFTVLAPTDEAFAKLPKGTVESLLKPENRDKLVSILTYHVVPGSILAKDALVAASAATVQGDSIAFGLQGGRLRVNESNVVQNDIKTTNGVIHVIDAVLLPPEKAPQKRKIIGIFPSTVSNSLRKLLGLDQGEGLSITRVSRGSGAEDAGLADHDVIVAINGKRATSEALDEAKAAVEPGEFIELLVAKRIRVRVGEE